MVREIRFYKNYFIDFYVAQDIKVQEKIEYVFKLIRNVERVPEKFLKHIESTDGLYEIRIRYRSDIFRIFCCFDEGRVVILFNAFQKKTQKTSKKEIEKGLKLKAAYFQNKKGGKS
ncbi:MAG: type II toxin-antitoxin system RelE/ParE family toxin [Bacteroidales bacterium]|nr:type II toxin-antitoxin system RelE/ParE family toxin [Bacteroidales bacterium]